MLCRALGIFFGLNIKVQQQVFLLDELKLDKSLATQKIKLINLTDCY